MTANPNPMKPTPKEAAQRLYSLCNELKNYNVDLEDIEALHQVSLRYDLHFSKLESFRKRLRKWAEGLC